MGRKKKRDRKPQCWYCERVFDDEKILIQHQKAKHFKCKHCHKKLSTAGGMVIHVAQVHKETITKVPNAKEGRDSVDIEIYGMDGVPDWGKEVSPAAKKPKITPTTNLLLAAATRQQAATVPAPVAPTGAYPPAPTGIPAPWMTQGSPGPTPWLPQPWGMVPPGYPPAMGGVYPPPIWDPSFAQAMPTPTMPPPGGGPYGGAPPMPAFPAYQQPITTPGLTSTQQPAPGILGQYPQSLAGRPSAEVQTQPDQDAQGQNEESVETSRIRFVYNEELSMEEKRAELSRYNFEAGASDTADGAEHGKTNSLAQPAESASQ